MASAVASTDLSRRPVAKIVIVDDDQRTLRSLRPLIRAEDFQVFYVRNDAAQALHCILDSCQPTDIVITDLKATAIGAFGLLNKLRTLRPSLVFIITTPFGVILYRGREFYRYVGNDLLQDINLVLEAVRPKGKELTISPTPKRQGFGRLIGQTEVMQQLYEQINAVAKTSVTVLLQGETGTGKELVARTIHEQSDRRQGPFLAINCGAIPINLVESELFGHEKGAFTSALAVQRGKFELAAGGTLFLDEIAELDKGAQVKLLRVIQEREAQRLGAVKPYRINVRVIAATAKNLAGEVQQGNFREDLFYRLHVMPIYLPPLRERLADIPLLAEHLITKIAAEMQIARPNLSAEALELLGRYDYPGNVRELENILARILVSNEHGTITAAEVRRYFAAQPYNFQIQEQGYDQTEVVARLDELEKKTILQALQRTQGNKKAAAALLGITRRHLYLKLKRYGLAMTKVACV